jgi:hypothetical protein
MEAQSNPFGKQLQKKNSYYYGTVFCGLLGVLICILDTYSSLKKDYPISHVASKN